MLTQYLRGRGALIRAVWAGLDALIWVVAIFAAVWMRYDFSFPSFDEVPQHTAILAAIAACIHVTVGYVMGPYRVGHARGSYEETYDLGVTAIITIVATFALMMLVWHPVNLPRSSPISGGAMAVLGMLTLRLIRRTTRHLGHPVRDDVTRVIIYGAGMQARSLVRSTLSGAGGILPVALLDDNKAKAKLRIDRIPVRGTRHDLAAVAKQTNASMVVVSTSKIRPKALRELSVQAADLGLTVKILPPMSDVINGSVRLGDLRDLNLTDLLGRRPVHLDTTAIAAHIQGKKVMVTGAGGSIGSELARQIAVFEPAELYLLDRDESGLQATQMSLTGQGLLDADDILLADIRDPQVMRELFVELRPDIVFHAAALKHLPLLERFPLEGWKTNVIGTLNVLEAAAAAEVETFVNISTDKAADPTSVLGYTKRLTERLTSDFALAYPGRYVSVRFGNVLGSRGSVIHAFTAQIAAGGPVTVTDPNVERYFMLIPEACQLVLQAATMGADGEVMVLEMGEQVKIVEVAQSLIRMSGRKDIEIVFTGLRPGEKLGEDLFADVEGSRSTAHPLVNAVDVPPVSPSVVRAMPVGNADVVRQWMESSNEQANQVIAEHAATPETAPEPAPGTDDTGLSTLVAEQTAQASSPSPRR